MKKTAPLPRATSGARTAAPIRPPQQARSRAGLERILDAAEKLFETHYFDDLSVEELVREAQVSIGSFYARFADKTALLYALCDRYFAGLEALLPDREAEQLASAPLAERVRRIVTGQVERFRRRRGLLRALSMYARLHPEFSTPAFVTQQASGVDRLARLLLGNGAEIRHSEPSAAVQMGLFFVSAVCREKILYDQNPHARTLRAGDRQLAAELTRMLLAYLGGHITELTPPD